MQLRPATEIDIPAIQAIYAHHVLTGTGTFEELPPSVADLTDRWRSVTGRGWTWIVAESDGEADSAVAGGGEVVGFGYYAQIRDRSAYRFTAEDSIYVRHDVRGQGVGKALVARLLEAAAAQGFRQMIAVIGDSENVGSIGVHASLGFVHVGTMRATGYKFGRWLDVVTMQKALGAGDRTLPED